MILSFDSSLFTTLCLMLCISRYINPNLVSFHSRTLPDKLVSLELSQALRLNLELELMTVEYSYLLSTKREYRLIAEYILKS